VVVEFAPFAPVTDVTPQLEWYPIDVARFPFPPGVIVSGSE
jgi:hypothetical protein